MTDSSSEIWQGVVERLGWGGQGIARAEDGRLILLDAPRSLIPGEAVEAELSWKARHGEGNVLRWLKEDQRRLSPPDAAELHPGYPLYGLPRELADELKRQMTADLLRRTLPLAPVPQWLASPAEARRSRIQLHWDGRQLGPHASKTNRVVSIEREPLAASSLSSAIPLLRDALRDNRLPNTPARWELATGTPDGDLRVSCSGQTWRIPVGTQQALDPYSDSSPLLHHFGSASLQQHPRAFFQACPAWAWQAFSEVLLDWELQGAALFDLYGGGGFFSRLLAQRFTRFVLVESSPLSCADAARNLAGLAVELCETDVARWLAAQPQGWAGPADTLLLDPPRSGLSPQLATRIAACGAGRLVLVGCDGAACCRDIRRLSASGRWRLDKLAVIDLFPMTPDVECVALLRRASDG